MFVPERIVMPLPVLEIFMFPDVAVPPFEMPALNSVTPVPAKFRVVAVALPEIPKDEPEKSSFFPLSRLLVMKKLFPDAGPVEFPVKVILLDPLKVLLLPAAWPVQDNAFAIVTSCEAWKVVITADFPKSTVPEPIAVLLPTMRVPPAWLNCP